LSGATLEDAKQFLVMVSASTSNEGVQQAAVQAKQVLVANTNYIPAVIILARQQEQQGKYDDAKKLYAKALAVYPSFSPAGRNLAVLTAQHPGNEQFAYEAGMKARGAFPDDADLTGALGIMAYRHGDYARAAELLREGTQKVSNDGILLYYLGKADYQLKQKRESKDALQRALNLNLESDLAADARKMLAELK
jgi:tetratricopeptide (TPR) repeat protein